MNHDEPCNVTSRAIFICISLIANDVEHLFAYYLVFMYLLWRNVYLDPLGYLN